MVELMHQNFNEIKEIFKESGKFMISAQKRPGIKWEGYNIKSKLLDFWILRPLRRKGSKYGNHASRGITLNGLFFVGITKIEIDESRSEIRLIDENIGFEFNQSFDFEALTSIEI